ncbi:MAG TPA: thioredoxin domain-containing protein [Gemmatimonadales bacterium]|nr:thioredoxin domain-containing protein [Gemmatimonadales bacterium]
MNRFYLLLVLVAVVAGVLMWVGSRGASGDVSATSAGAPVVVTSADSAFQGYVLGSATAPVEVVEYADLQCPHCGEFANVQFPTIREQLINTGQLRWRFRDFPLNFPWSRLSALAGQCAGEQGKFWEMEDMMFQRQSAWGSSSRNPTAAFRDLARGAGADLDKYNACMDSQRYAGRVEASHREGVARGVTGTPTFFVNGRQLDNNRFGNSDAFQHLVDSLTGKGRR